MNRYDGIRIKLLPPSKMARLSYGEVVSSDTLHPTTGIPVRGGLFCEQIFGPSQHNKCACGRLKGRKAFIGAVCQHCLTEIQSPLVRRVRFGHITLAAPVVHSYMRRKISALLNLSGHELEQVIQCTHYIVTHPGDTGIERWEIISEEAYSGLKGKSHFLAETGGTVLKMMLSRLDLEALELDLMKREPSRRVNYRLSVVRDFLQSNQKPEWMILDAILVLPPALRPIIIMENGTSASSQLNDLYARLLHRNKRLKRLIAMQAPEILLTVERRSLQNAIDALFDNGKKVQATARGSKRLLKSFAQVLSGKGGRLRRNLLGKRVDFSGRSQITVGPTLKLHQCGLPYELAIDLMRPMLYHVLMQRGHASNLKNARMLVDRRYPAALDALDEVIKDRVIILNRAPSLHRMSMQAFEPVLESGKAIRLHPLVCSAFNADFDGDQMGVHLPVTVEAQIETQVLMLSIQNIISPATGKMIALPSQDMVLGLYWLTKQRPGCRGHGTRYSDRQDVITTYQQGVLDEHAMIQVRVDGKLIDSTPGRVIFADVFPSEVPFEKLNTQIKKKNIGQLCELVYALCGRLATAQLLDRLKDLGFKYATEAGISLCVDDMTIPKDKERIIAETADAVQEAKAQYMDGLMTEPERYKKVCDLWIAATEEVAKVMMDRYGEPESPEGMPAEELKLCKEYNSVFMMADSGARGSTQQIKQCAGMRGLMAKTTGDLVEVPITSNLREGQRYFEFLLSSHGARKGRADGALKTATAGYFTRKLVDAMHDVIVSIHDCGTRHGMRYSDLVEGDVTVIALEDRIWGKVLAEDVYDPKTGEPVAFRGQMISAILAKSIASTSPKSVLVRSAVTCEAERGVCSVCYGSDLSTWDIVSIGEAVGVIAAQSIGEPGTQMTLRTFHSGGSATGSSVMSALFAKSAGTLSLSRVRTIRRSDGSHIVANRGGRFIIKDGGFEADDGALPYGAALLVADGARVDKGDKLAEWDANATPILAPCDGIAQWSGIISSGASQTVKEERNEETDLVTRTVIAVRKDAIPAIVLDDEHTVFLPVGAVIMADCGKTVKAGDMIARIPVAASKNADITSGLPRVLQLLEVRKLKDPAVLAPVNGTVKLLPRRGKKLPIEIRDMFGGTWIVPIKIERPLTVTTGDEISAGEPLAEGQVFSRDILNILGPEAAARFIIDEVQKVYRSNGISIHDKHFELFAAKMLSKVKVTWAGNTNLVADELVEKSDFAVANRDVSGSPARAIPVLLSLSNIPMNSKSWLSAASFQRTTTILVNAACKKQKDPLLGLKENIIIGNYIPAGTGHDYNRNISIIESPLSRRGRKGADRNVIEMSGKL